jgi:RNA polymerase sigma factor (sigma-70 family)
VFRPLPRMLPGSRRHPPDPDDAHAAKLLSALSNCAGYPRQPLAMSVGKRALLNKHSALRASYRGVEREAGVVTSRIDRLYREDGARLWRAVYAYSGNRDIASDAVAEAFAQCLARGEAVEAPQLWIWKAAFKIAAGELKERRRWVGEPPDRSYSAPEVGPDLEAALRQLSARERAILSLAHAGYSSREIAHVVGSAAVTVRVHLVHARRKLRDKLGGSE